MCLAPALASSLVAFAGDVFLDAGPERRVDRTVMGRHRKVGAALEDGEVADFLDNSRDGLHARRAGADHAHTSARQPT